MHQCEGLRRVTAQSRIGIKTWEKLEARAESLGLECLSVSKAKGGSDAQRVSNELNSTFAIPQRLML